jgi:predicted SnoaL-like aldol condensation-catalyzing enzyme
LKLSARHLLLPFLLCFPFALRAQAPVEGTLGHGPLLASANPRLAANKRLVYDFWREVLDAGHVELAEKYLTESYIQHNPNVPTGRAGFIAYFAKAAQPKAIEPGVQAHLVAITAEGDKVIISVAAKVIGDDGKPSTTTWFDMFRVENGRIAEHWDVSPKY